MTDDLLEVVLSPKARAAFDGRVLEFFYFDQSGQTSRFHLAYVGEIGLTTDKKGRHYLDIKTTLGYPWRQDVDDNHLSQVQQLIAAVLQARAAA